MKQFRKHSKTISSGLILALLFELLAPATALANTGNENQVEFSSAGGGGGEMVNMYTGALNYSIPLMSIPGQGIGYNVTLNYNSDEVKMMNTASMVGFGWNLNIGSISRQVQAVPDDFNGDPISYRSHVKPYKSWDLGLGDLSSVETWGLPFDLESSISSKAKSAGKGLTGHVYFDNYSGLGFRIGYSKSEKIGDKSSLGAGVEYDTKRGVGFHLSGSYGFISSNASFYSLKGLQSLGMGVCGVSNGITFASLIPPVQTEMTTSVRTGSLKLGLPFLSKGTGGVSAPSAATDMKTLFKKSGVEKVVKFRNDGILGSAKMDFVISEVTSESFTKAANGYLYRLNAEGNNLPEENIKDFIRYPLSYSKGTTFLPISQLGTDVFVQSDQGSGGVFTARTNSFETWSSQKTVSQTNSRHIGGEFGMSKALPKNFHVGGNFLYGKGSSASGQPEQFVPNNFSKARTPLIKSSEIHIEKNSALPAWGNDNASRFEVTSTGDFFKGEAHGALKSSISITNGKKENSGSVPHLSRQSGDELKQQSYVQYLTTYEATRYGRSKDFGYLKAIRTTSSAYATPRAQHIAEINVFENNGMIYTYSNPVYSRRKVDAMFSINTRDEAKVGVNEIERITPATNVEGTGDNQRITFGKATDIPGTISDLHTGMELLNVTETPGYATSWPVTMITSADYVDVDANGPSNNDLGAWVKFTYTDTEPARDTYKWRSPYSGVQVTDGVKQEGGDDLGFYRYGEKEIKYIEKIETKTHYAEFIYSARNDGGSVGSELYGGKDASEPNLKKLEKVNLYLKRNELPLVDNKYQTTLLQTVYFEYNYSLVQGETSNGINGGGKLTLTKVYSTFYKSSRGSNYSYDFDYGTVNPKYNTANLDRWGDFKQNKTENNTFTSANYPFQDFPYTEENLSVVAPWCLKSVKLPTGATLSFEYEARDYAYVENKPATKMYDIVSVDDLREDEPQADLETAGDRNVANTSYSEGQVAGTTKTNDKDHVVIALPDDFDDEANDAARDQRFFNEYLSGIQNELYIKPYVHLHGISKYEWNKDQRDYDYVDLMARLDTDDSFADVPYAVKKVGQKYYGIIELDKPHTQGLNPFKISPIRAAAFEHIKHKRPEIYFGRMDANGVHKIGEAIELLYRSLDGGMTTKFLDDQYASHIRYNGWSKIRLKDPKGFKQGGGYRIKAVTMDDNWKPNGSAAQSSSYKQVYNYTIFENGRTISSGVASEPAVGREEDARHQLFYYEEVIPSLEWNKHVIAGNPMDVYNDAPSIGYRKVTVSNEYPLDVVNEIQLSVAPHTEYLFNTSYDYPTIKKFTQTTSQYMPLNYSVGYTGAGSLTVHDNTVSQGYCVVKNDMAGKLKKITQLSRTNRVISSQEYEYFSDPKSAIVHTYTNNFRDFPVAYTVDHLKNEGIATINSGVENSTDKLKIENVRVGEDYDIWLDVNENSESSYEIGYGNINVGFSSTTLNYLMPIPMPYNYINKQDKQAVLNKVINRRGVLKEVKTFKDQSEIRTGYLAYDQETAAPILTKVDNEWHNTKAGNTSSPVKDPSIYKFVHPAYWEYQSAFMGAYKTIDKQYPTLSVSPAGVITQSGVSFSDGDVVAYKVGNSEFAIGYVSKENNTYKLYTDKYIPVAVSVNNVRVIRSGNTNLINTTVGELVSKECERNLGDTLKMSDFLNASAITFKPVWEKNCCTGGASEDYLSNPYINGAQNNWLPYQSFVFYADRSYTNSSYSQRGLLNGYRNFNWQTGKGANWVLSSEAVKYDLFGNLLEQKNALGLPSSSLFGYGKTVTVGVASNSARKEMAVENFEETGYDNCGETGNSGVTNGLQIGGTSDQQISNDKSHTGRYSLKIVPGKKLTVSKVIIQCK
ncbi:MAG: hypothetical protein ACKOXB_00970 [Flavobacteriales bacterium]